MGSDLSLLPLRGPDQLVRVSVGCLDRLSFDRDYEIFGQLIDSFGDKPTIQVNSIPPQMWVEGAGIARTRVDGYGNKLTFVYAQQLKRLLVPSDASPWNRAIMAFIEALPDDTPIILYWS